MPLIKGKPRSVALSAERRAALLAELQQEFTRPLGGGPCIFEIPLSGSDRIDVMVVWDKFDRVRSEDRTNLVLDAYEGQTASIAQALGVTTREALEQNLLPYKVVPLGLAQNGNATEIQQAMLAEGGMQLPNQQVDLRLPSLSVAQGVVGRLSEKLPKGRWSIMPAEYVVEG